jgi:diacylglycerol kinase family enzyme
MKVICVRLPWMMGSNIVTKMTMRVVANGKFLGGGFKAVPQADVSNSLLDVIILKHSGSFKILDELVNMKIGNYSNEDEIFYIQAKKVSMDSKKKDVTVTVDGELIGILPAFQVLPNILNVRI